MRRSLGTAAALAAVAMAVAALMTGCGGGSGGASSTSGRSSPSTGHAGGATPSVDEAGTDDEATSPRAPSDVVAVKAALAAMPETLAGAPRTGADGEARYHADQGAAFGLEVLEFGDMVGPNTDLTVDEAVRAQVTDPATCAGSRSVCVRGGDGAGGAVTVWASDDGALVFAAVAPDRETVWTLENAWNNAVAAAD